VAGILQALYSQGQYSRVDFIFEKLRAELAGKTGLNQIYYIVCQAYYELNRDKELTLSTS